MLRVFIVLLFLGLGSANLFSQIINIEEKRIRTRDSVHWYGECSLSAAFMKLNKNILTLRGTAQVEYKRNKHLWLSLSDYAFLNGGGIAFENAAFQHLRYNYKFRPRLTLEIFGQLQDNKIQHIKLRTLAGGGLRWKMMASKNEKNRLYFGASFMNEVNKFKGGDDANFLRLSNYLSLICELSQTLKLNSTTYYQPDILDLKNARLSSQTTFFFRINKHLSFRTDFNIAYDPTLPNAINALSYNWVNGLRWNL